MRIVGRVVVAFAGAVVTIGCGDDGSAGPPPSDIDRMAPFTSLSPSQLGELCDWSNAQLGGYGRMETCKGGNTVSTLPSHDVCVAHPPPSTCPATVGQVEDCVTALAPKSSSLCALASSFPPACAALRPSCAVFI